MAQPVSEDHRPSISGASVDTDGLRPAATSAAGWTAGSSWTVAARWTIGAWIALSVATFIRLNIGIARGIAIRRTTRPADDGPLHVMLRRAVAEHGVRRRVELRVSDAVECPAVWCWLRPCVILPQSIDRPHVDWRAVLAHEVAHLARRDHLTAMAAELLVCMLPWHPLSWIARRWLAELAEEACDDWAMGSARDATEYAASLLSFRPAHRGAMLAIVSGSSVSARVRRILHDLAGDTRIGRRLARHRRAGAGDRRGCKAG
jgi:beta-lactamase regulating signal transducer with metallopeptidase domain